MHIQGCKLGCPSFLNISELNEPMRTVVRPVIMRLGGGEQDILCVSSSPGNSSNRLILEVSHYKATILLCVQIVDGYGAKRRWHSAEIKRY
jgi:hypothetical protein